MSILALVEIQINAANRAIVKEQFRGHANTSVAEKPYRPNGATTNSSRRETNHSNSSIQVTCVAGGVLFKYRMHVQRGLSGFRTPILATQ
jgi:hypothetical protein